MALDFLPLFIPCGMSFASDFYYHHIGTKYDKDTMLNPIKRCEMEKKQWIFIRKKFPVFFGVENVDDIEKTYKLNPSIGIGVATVPKIWGCEIQYRDHMNPTALPLIGNDVDPLTLKEPDYDEGMHWLFEEIDLFQSLGFKKSNISLPDLQSPLNIATKVIGDKRMLGLIARKNKESIVQHILDVSTKVYLEVVKRLKKATDKAIKGNWSYAGCTLYYLSPEQFTKFCVPMIQRMMEELGNSIRLHHCGQANSDKIRSYAQIQWNDLEFGFGSDLKLVRELFNYPKTGPVHISCRISPYRMLNQTKEQIEQDVNWIIENAKGGPMSINVVGVPYNTPEANLWTLWNTVQAYNKKKELESEEA